MSNRVLGERDFNSGQRRTVYADQDGRQYILDSQGRRVYGVWLLPSTEDTVDLPIIVEAPRDGL